MRPRRGRDRLGGLAGARPEDETAGATATLEELDSDGVPSGEQSDRPTSGLHAVQSVVVDDELLADPELAAVVALGGEGPSSRGGDLHPAGPHHAEVVGPAGVRELAAGRGVLDQVVDAAAVGLEGGEVGKHRRGVRQIVELGERAGDGAVRLGGGAKPLDHDGDRTRGLCAVGAHDVLEGVHSGEVGGGRVPQGVPAVRSPVDHAFDHATRGGGRIEAEDVGEVARDADVVARGVDHDRDAGLGPGEVRLGHIVHADGVAAEASTQRVAHVLDVLGAESQLHVGESAAADVAVAHDRAGRDAVAAGAVVDTQVMGVRHAAVVAQLVVEDHEIPVRAVVVLDRVGEAPVQVPAHGIGIGATEAGEPRDAATETAAAQEVGEIAVDRGFVRLPVVAELAELVAGAGAVPGILARPEPEAVGDHRGTDIAGVDEARRRAEGGDVSRRGIGVPTEQPEEFGVGLDREADALAADAVRVSFDAIRVDVAGPARTYGDRLFDEIGLAEVLEQFGGKRRHRVEPVDRRHASSRTVGETEANPVDRDPAFDTRWSERDEHVLLEGAGDAAGEGDRLRYREGSDITVDADELDRRVAAESLQCRKLEIDSTAIRQRETRDPHRRAERDGVSNLFEQHRIGGQREAVAGIDTVRPPGAGDPV